MLRSTRSRALFLTTAVALLATAGAAQMQPLDTGSVMAAVESLKPGQYIWAPEIAPQGPMLVMVNLASQRAVAYRNGVPFAVSTVSTGRPGHRTPTGVFTILQKRVHHRSSTYNNAPMPFMQRLTWRGVALHGGSLPGYPASHGCIRLPHDFARLLFGETALGMTVVIVDREGELRLGGAPDLAGLPQTGPATWRPELAPSGPVSIVVSAADRRMIVMRGGVEIGSAPVSFDGVVDRVQAYVMTGIVGGEYRWRKIALGGQQGAGWGEPAPVPPARVQGSDPFRQALASVVTPGTTMVVIPDSLGRGSRLRAPEMTVIDDAPPLDGAGLAIGR